MDRAVLAGGTALGELGAHGLGEVDDLAVDLVDAIPGGFDHIVADALDIGGRAVDLAGVVFECLDPPFHVCSAPVRIVPGAEPVAGHHRADFGAELFPRISGGAMTVADAFDEGLAVHAVGVAGAVCELVEGGLVVVVRRGELAAVGEDDAVALEVVVGPVALLVVNGDSGLGENGFGNAVGVPGGAGGAVPAELQPGGLFRVEDGERAPPDA